MVKVSTIKTQSPLKSGTPEKRSSKAPKRKAKYTTYIQRLVKKLGNGEFSIESSAVEILHKLTIKVVTDISKKAGELSTAKNTKTVSPEQIESAIMLLFNGKLDNGQGLPFHKRIMEQVSPHMLAFIDNTTKDE